MLLKEIYGSLELIVIFVPIPIQDVSIMSSAKPFVVKLGNDVIVVKDFDDALGDLGDYAYEAEHPFWYIVATDAWFEYQQLDGVSSLVARTFDETYFHLPVSEEILKYFSVNPEEGVLLIETELPLTPESLQNQFGDNATFEAICEWVNKLIEEDKHIRFNTLCWCFLNEEQKKELHDEE